MFVRKLELRLVFDKEKKSERSNEGAKNQKNIYSAGKQCLPPLVITVWKVLGNFLHNATNSVLYQKMLKENDLSTF